MGKRAIAFPQRATVGGLSGAAWPVCHPGSVPEQRDRKWPATPGRIQVLFCLRVSNNNLIVLSSGQHAQGSVRARSIGQRWLSMGATGAASTLSVRYVAGEAKGERKTGLLTPRAQTRTKLTG